MMLNLEKGWEEEDGKVSIGASEKAETDSGEELLDAQDLFEGRELSADDSKVLTLSVTLPQLKADVEYVLISFRIWDKNGKGEIKGSYKLYPKQ
jgi:hypothetical protein